MAHVKMTEIIFPKTQPNRGGACSQQIRRSWSTLLSPVDLIIVMVFLTGLPQRSIKTGSAHSQHWGSGEVRTYYGCPKGFPLAASRLENRKWCEWSKNDQMSWMCWIHERNANWIKPGGVLGSADSGQFVETLSSKQNGGSAFCCYAVRK